MLLYLLVSLYLLATAFSSTDEDLLLGKTVTIAQIGASLPVSFSFAIVPLVAAFPVVILLLVQINVLRYQSQMIRWTQFAWLLADLAALVWFFRRNPLREGLSIANTRGTEVRRWAGLPWRPATILAINLLYLNVVPADTDARLVRHSGSATFAEAVSQPLDVLACPWLGWGCRYLRRTMHGGRSRKG